MTVEQNLANGEVRYIDRHTGELKTEDIYGERVLRWVYGNPLGRMAQWLLIRRWIVSAWYGSKMDEVKSSLRIVPFINKYGLDESEFADPVGEYLSFNEFFYRKLKLKSRPIDTEDNSLVFPADGRHMAFANISSENNFIVKGQIFNLKQFLGDDELAERYKDRDGGYCRIIKLGKNRLGDNSEMAIIQLLGSEGDKLSELKTQKSAKKKQKKKESTVLKEVSEEIQEIPETEENPTKGLKQENVTHESGKEVRLEAEIKAESDEEELIQEENPHETKAKDTAEIENNVKAGEEDRGSDKDTVNQDDGVGFPAVEMP